jgi:hypothetical protein
VRKKKKKKRRRKKNTMKKNIMNMKWFYSSRNSTSSLREEGLIREKGKRSQCQRRCAIITTRIDISLPNAHMRGRKKTMTRERSLTKTTRKIRNIVRRSLMVKLMLAKNETQVMRVLNRKAMTWQPQPSRAKLYQASHSSLRSQSIHASWQRKVERR